MEANVIEAACLYRSFLRHCFYDVEKLSIEDPSDGYSSSILESFSSRSLLERCDVIRARPRSGKKALQIVALDCPKSHPGAAILVSDEDKDEVYCLLHLYKCDGVIGHASPTAGLPRRWRTTVLLPGCNKSVQMMFVEGLLFFCQPDLTSGVVLMLDTSLLTCDGHVLTAQPILKGISFVSLTGCYDAAIRCVLLSLLDVRSLLSVAVPVDPRGQTNDVAVLNQLPLSVPRGSLHFHVCCDILVVCPSRITECGWTTLVSLGTTPPMTKFEMRAKVCLQYCFPMRGDGYLFLLALGDGTVQLFQASSSPPSIAKTGALTRVLDGELHQRGAVRCSPAGHDCVALISRRQCALLSVADAAATGVVTVLSRYDAPAVSNMAVLKMHFPAALQENFPYVLLVSTWGQSCVRVFSFQRPAHVITHPELTFCGAGFFAVNDALDAAMGHSGVRGPHKKGLLTHIRRILQKKRVHRPGGSFEPCVKEEHVITTVCHGFGMTLRDNKRCPPYEIFVLDPRLRGFLISTAAFDSHDCYVVRDAAVHDALQQVAALIGNE